MIQASFIAASTACLIVGGLSLIKAGASCPPSKKPFRIVSALVWFSLASLYMAILFGLDSQLIRTGIVSRLLIISQALIYSGELLLERKE